MFENALPAPITLVEFAERIRCVCALYDCTVTSWCRTEDRNAAVGGADASKHRLATGSLAVDLVLDDASVKSEMLEGVKRLGMRWLDEGDHIHVQALPPGG